MKEFTGVFIMLLWLGMAVGNLVWISERGRLCEKDMDWSVYAGVVIVAPAFWSIFTIVPIDKSMCGEK